jgi:two-component system, chemotaxis family, chemotaxis protein CheY
MPMEKTILIVDDSESIREVVIFTLENAGYNVVSAIDGMDALKHLNGQHLDMILTDLHMPNLDGIGLIKEVRRIDSYKYIPILYLTTESQQSIKNEARQAGATGWIVKPFMPDKLIAAIAKIVK